MEFPTAQLYHVAVTHEIPYHVCGAQQDSSTICVPNSGGGRGGGGGGGRGGGNTYSAGGGESGYIATDPLNPNIFYAGSQGALLTRFDRHTNYSQRRAGLSAVLLRRIGRLAAGALAVDFPDRLFAAECGHDLHLVAALMEDHRRRT